MQEKAFLTSGEKCALYRGFLRWVRVLLRAEYSLMVWVTLGLGDLTVEKVF